jgi:hypothetical protein
LSARRAEGHITEESVRAVTLSQRMRAETWTATLYELEPGAATAAYHYE